MEYWLDIRIYSISSKYNFSILKIKECNRCE